MPTPTISGSVGVNATNRKEDVTTVQGLLNRAPPPGGPSEPLAVDGVCYGRTLEAIRQFQEKQCGFRWPDQRIDPGGRTWSELVKFAEPTPPAGVEYVRCFPRSASSQVSFAPRRSLTAAPSTAPASATLVAEAIAHIPVAALWANQALQRCEAVLRGVQRYKVYSKPELEQAAPFATHFKISLTSQSEVVVRGRLGRVRATFVRIERALAALPARLVGDPSQAAKALAPLGGFDIPGAVVTIGADFVGPSANSNLKAAVLIHECAHFVDRRCGHVASELPAPHGTAIRDANGQRTNPQGLDYGQMDFDLAIQNAYSFAQCAVHCGLGSDRRPL